MQCLISIAVGSLIPERPTEMPRGNSSLARNSEYVNFIGCISFELIISQHSSSRQNIKNGETLCRVLILKLLSLNDNFQDSNL
jgi:hypothetical protein